MTDGPAVGQRFAGRYEVIEAIASGGMADVSAAQDQLLDRRVALKILRPEYARDASFVERFRREALAAASLTHSHIVSIYDTGTDENGIPFLVLELVSGRSLKQIIEEEGKLSIDRATEIAIEACEALDFAHKHGLVHRDVKPANILITAGGQSKVTDFGIARAFRDSGHTLTQAGMVMGTAAYLSPEQAQGHPVDPRSDIYSMGCVLYEMITGRPPFTADAPLALAYKHARDYPDPPSRYNPDAAGPLDAIVMKCLAKNPDNRYASASEVGQDLRRFQRGQPVDATPLLPGDYDSAATAAIAVASDRTGMIATTQRSSVSEAPIPPRAKRGRAFGFIALILLFLGLLAASLATIFTMTRGPDTIEVPNVAGLRAETAERLLERKNLLPQTNPDEFSDTVAAGRVIAQQPAGGRKIEKGASVRLTISKGPELIAVPDLRNKEQRVAEKLIKDAQLAVGLVSTEPSDTVPGGIVLRQDPRPGDRKNKGEPVDLVVSAGKEQAKVLNVVGFDEQEARKNLQNVGFDSSVKEACEAGKNADTVLAQNPTAGSSADKGSTVELTVNRLKKVPDVVGESEKSATAILTESGFQFLVTQQDAQPGKQDKVIAQAPAADKTSCPDTPVRVTLES